MDYIGNKMINYKYMKKTLIIVLFLALLGFVGARFVYGMAATKELPLPKAYIVNVSGDVNIKRTDTGDWQKVTKDMEIAKGDTIKTGSDGKISINFFDDSISHIGPDSEVGLADVFIDNTNYAKTKIKLRVNFGRVWSRIIQLGDQEASYEVESNDTVATVRGTIFDFIVVKGSSTKVSTIENTVEVSMVEAEEFVDPITKEKKIKTKVIKKIDVPAGKLTEIAKEIDKEKKELFLLPISQEEMDSVWYKQNREEDKKIEEEIRKKQEDINKEIAGILPDSPLYGLKQLAEKTRLAFAADENKKLELEIGFLNKRLAESQALAANGKTVLAEEFFENYSKNIIEAMEEAKKGKDGQLYEKFEAQIGNQIDLQKRIMGAIDPEDPSYQLKNSLQQLQLNIVPEIEKQFLQMKIEQERSGVPMMPPPLPVKGVDQIIQPTGTTTDVNRIIENINQVATTTFQKPIIGTTTPPPPPPPPPQIIQKPIIGEQVITKPTTTLPLPPPPPPAETVRKLVDLKVSALKYNMLLTETRQFKAIAAYSDGTTKDVSNLCQWRVNGDIGTISSSGLLSPDADGGSATIEAAYTEEGTTVRGASPTVTALTIIL